MDALLINPASRARVYQALGTSLAAIENPVWAGLIASYLRARGREVGIIDAEALSLDAEAVARAVGDVRPSLAVVVVYGHQPSASTQHMTGASQIVKALKQRHPEIPVLMVGGHVAALPERTLADEACDFVSVDDGLQTTAALIDAVARRETAAVLADAASLRKVPGLAWRCDDRVEINGAAPLIQDLDRELPAMPWDLLPMHAYRAHNWHCFDAPDQRQPYAALYTSLGCPYHCSFCCIQAPFKRAESAAGLGDQVNSYRRWTAAAVLREIDHLVSYFGVRNIKIADELFVLDPRHVRGICDELIARDYQLNMWAYARVDTIRDGMAARLKRAGVNWLALGIEAADEGVLAGVDKRHSRAQVRDTVATLRAEGIRVIANFIFGLPDDTRDTMQATLDFAQELNCEFANFYSTMAYPGSALFAQATREGWRLPDTWAGYSQHAVDTLPLPTRHVSAGDVLAFRDRAFHQYFTAPAYLDMVTRTFGDAARTHVEQMTLHTLERRYATR